MCGCVTYPKYPKYTQSLIPTFDPKSTERTINRCFDEVWTALIEYAASTFFAINNFEKESGLLTLRFGAGNPAEFIDCGYVESATTAYKGSLIGGLQQSGYADLDGSMNIFVKPISDKATQVKVNARYVFKGNDGVTTQIWSFDTGDHDSKRFSAVQQPITCSPTYKAERTILEGIEQIAQGN